MHIKLANEQTFHTILETIVNKSKLCYEITAVWTSQASRIVKCEFGLRVISAGKLWCALCKCSRVVIGDLYAIRCSRCVKSVRVEALTHIVYSCCQGAVLLASESLFFSLQKKVSNCLTFHPHQHSTSAEDDCGAAREGLDVHETTPTRVPFLWSKERSGHLTLN